MDLDTEDFAQHAGPYAVPMSLKSQMNFIHQDCFDHSLLGKRSKDCLTSLACKGLRVATDENIRAIGDIIHCEAGSAVLDIIGLCDGDWSLRLTTSPPHLSTH